VPSEQLSPADSGGRRELNKRATRTAISTAALSLARAHGPGGFTVDQLAEEAGISRRTFFNYFPSIEAALTRPVEEFLEGAFAQLYDRPADEPIMDAVLATLGGDVSQEQMALLCEIYAMGEDDPQLERVQLQVWNKAQQKLEEGLRVRLSRSESDLLINSLAGALIACGQAAMREAAAETAGRSPDTGAFQKYLLASIGMLRTGFNSLSKDS
jgi:AcrR family transcriptional regulator